MEKKELYLCPESFPGLVAGAIGKGLIAGFCGTVAMTISQKIEMKKTGRSGSDTPALAGGKVLGVQPVDEMAKNKFNNVVHFGYGSLLGIIRGMLTIIGIRGIGASIFHAVIMQVLSFILLPGLKVAPPAKEWGKKAIAIEGLHHVVLAIFAGIVYDYLDRC